MKMTLSAYWANLNERERVILGIGIIVCVGYLFYLLIYSPLTNAVYHQSKALLEKQETLAWMQQVRAQHKLKQPRKALTSSQLLAVLALQLKTTSFKQFPYQLQQTGAGEIQLIFEQVPYNGFVAWVWSITEKYTITIKQLNVERTSTAGIVKVTMMIVTA